MNFKPNIKLIASSAVSVLDGEKWMTLELHTSTDLDGKESHKCRFVLRVQMGSLVDI